MSSRSSALAFGLVRRARLGTSGLRTIAAAPGTSHRAFRARTAGPSAAVGLAVLCGCSAVAVCDQAPDAAAAGTAGTATRGGSSGHRELEGVWVQDQASCESMGEFLQEGLGFPWFVSKLADGVQTTLKISFPEDRPGTVVIVDKTMFGRNETTVELGAEEYSHHPKVIAVGRMGAGQAQHWHWSQ